MLFICCFCFFSFCYTVGLSVIGNALTETNFADGEFGTIYRSLGFADDGNDLVKTTDARGNTTEYTVDNKTSGNEEIIDRLGNIIAKYKYSYDGSGNIVRILDMLSEIEYTYTYEQGRLVRATEARVSLNGNASATKKTIVPANGIRTSKTVGGIKHDFTLDGTKILREVWGDNTLIPMYDNEDSVCGIIYNGVPYYFLKNLQGDIISIVDKDACVIARYSYDAWGVPTIVFDTSDCNIASINPFRYRGYFFDNEIGLYYLQSRYYNPVIGRFVNVDTPELLNSTVSIGCDLYTYCNNNPINDSDNRGNLGWGTFTKVLSYIFDLFVKIAQTAGNMSREVEDVVKAIKRAKKNGASKEWIKLLKKKKKSLVSHKALGTGKINAIATLLGLFATIFPYLSYIKKISNGISVLAELLVDVVVEIISCVSNLLVSLICKFIPYVGFLVSWALGYVVDIIISSVFNDSCLNRIKRDYVKRVKGSSSFKTWLTSMGKSMQLAF